MNLIFLYGPPAVGKLTIAKELKKTLGYKLLYNHMIMNIFEDIFPYDSEAGIKLVREFRLRIIEEAIKENIDLIITAGVAGSLTLFDYFTKLIETVESQGGHVYIVHLTADNEALLQRVKDEFRKQHGKNTSRKNMQELLDKHSALFDKYPLRDHLTLDTRKLSPQESAEKIISHHHLSKKLS